MTDYADNISVLSDSEMQHNYVVDDYSVASESTVKSDKNVPTKRKQRDYMDAYKLNDKSYHKVKRTATIGLNEKVGVYSTTLTPGSLIRDAITGGMTQYHRIGSVYADLYFKVVYATGEFGSETKAMYFDCPEQYERHLNTTVSQPTKKMWTNKFAAARKLLNEE